jgi:hypothetical protein
LPTIRTLDAAARSFTAFWTIWSAVSPARGDPPGVLDPADVSEPLELADPQAAAETTMAAPKIPAGTIRMTEDTGVLWIDTVRARRPSCSRRPG